MIDEVLNVKVEQTVKRAFKIYCAAEKKTEKEVVTAGLNSTIPPGYFRQAAKAIHSEKDQG